MQNLNWDPKLHNRSLLRLADLTDEEMLNLVELAIALKARRNAGIRGDLLHRKHIALIFEKSSTRTRNSASIAIRDEGGDAEYLTKPDIHLGAKESVKDTARVLGRIFDGILYRGFAQKTVDTLAKYSGVPVWNGLTDDCHPTQILADLMTLKENFGSLRGLRLAFIGDGRNNVANSLMLGCAKAGIHYVNCTPPELMPDPALVATATAIAAKNGSTVKVVHDPKAGVKGANALYTDVWVSMGEEAKRAERMKLLRPYQINMDLVKATGNLGGKLIFLHCLPAFHDRETAVSAEVGAMEVTDEVFEAPFSKVFEEAENRMHTIKALYVSSLCDPATAAL
jgi:ornithine carbamoyltransferase